MEGLGAKGMRLVKADAFVGGLLRWDFWSKGRPKSYLDQLMEGGWIGYRIRQK